MKRTGKLIAGATFAASLLFTKGIAPAFRPGDGQNYDGYSAAAEDYAETLPAEEIPENFVEAKKVVCENPLISRKAKAERKFFRKTKRSGCRLPACAKS